ncbi:MAG TPA: DUF58 domain-containing protein [Virgibacillus sp.]|nr:DUF58 domain-containing protein [Virgibacillus sp.]
MMWQRHFGESYYKNYDFLLTVLIVLIIIALFAGKTVIFTVIGIYAAYFMMYTQFDKHILKNITLKNPKHIIRLFPGEEGTLTFDLANKSTFPAINGQFRFQTDSSVHAKELSKEINNYWNQYQIPISLVRKGHTMLSFPIYAEHRGTARIRNITYSFPHLFNFDNVELHYAPFFKTEIIVFPEPKYVHGLGSVFEMTPGSHPVHSSVFEDIQDRVGTRDYHYSDAFARINWKASAKTHRLQTNVYEKVIDLSYLFIVNIETKLGEMNMVQFDENLENLLSYTAYLCQYATEKDIPFEMYINARKPGKEPFLHLQEGVGQTHFGNALEMLARIQRQSMAVPFDHMLYRIGKQLRKPQSIVLVGDVFPKAGQMIQSWNRIQNNISHVTAMGDDDAYLVPWGNKDHVDVVTNSRDVTT